MRCLITGGGRGIGRAMAVQLVSQGHEVLVNDTGCGLDGSPGVLEPSGALPPPFTFDLSTAAGCQQLWVLVDGSDTPPIDALVHCAALTQAPLATQVEVNLLAPLRLTEAFLPALRATHGVVLFFSSGVVDDCPYDHRFYTASKAGLEAYARCLAAQDEVDTYLVRPSAQTRLNPRATTTPEDIAQTCVRLLLERPPAYRGRVLSLPGQGRIVMEEVSSWTS